MQYIIPRDDTSSRSLSLPERAFLRNAARGVSSSAGSILRLDGRAPSEARPIRLSFSRCHNRAECTVQLGNGTRSAASVRAELVPPPNADRPNDGQVKFGVEVGPMGCMGYENTVPISNYAVGESVDGGQAGSGGGGDVPYIQRLMANRILRLLERTLIIGGSIDAEALCVQSGVWVWRLHVDVSLLDDGGNAMDACVLAAVAALRHYRLPEVSVGANDDDVEASEAVSSGYQETNIIHSDDREPTPLPLHHTPLTATFALFADETGTTTAVSALLDPYDREELACDGLLTWSFNKYGEMCCVDFPGGCELRPRQLTASSNLGKRRCIEICEMLETALEEAEQKAQQDRMDRLKQMNAMRQKVGDDANSTAISANVPVTDEDEEDEQYRLRALDYSSGHVAASVKEDKEKKGSQGKNTKGETSSLFHAILRSAQSTSLQKAADEHQPIVAEKKPAIEIVAHKVKQPSAATEKKTDPIKPKEKRPKPVQPAAPMDDSDEEEVIQLQSEFTTIAEQVPDQESAAPMEIDTNDSIPSVPEADKHVPKSKKSKSAKRTDEDDDVDDLAMAVKKKKKSKKPKKNKILVSFDAYLGPIFRAADASWIGVISAGRLRPYWMNASLIMAFELRSSSRFCSIAALMLSTSFTALSIAVLQPSPIAGVIACAASPIKATIPSCVE